jgi:predicted porin
VYVGLQNRFGTLSLGRHQTLLYDLSTAFDPMAISTRYSVLMHDKWMSSRSDNSVKFTGVAGGVYYGLLYSTGYDSSQGGEIPGAYKAGKEMSAALGYAAGPFAVRTLYDELRGSTVATQGNAERRAAVAGSYSVGSAKILAGYRYYAGTYATSTLHTNLYWAGAQFQATPTISITGTAYYTDVRRSSGDPYSFVLVGSYAFSKRTDIYAVAGYARNRDGSAMGLAGFGPSLNPNATTLINTSEQVISGESQFGGVIGVRHRF